MIAEADAKVRPDIVAAAIADSELAELRVGIEQIPGGTRIRVHAPSGDRASERRIELEAQLAATLDAVVQHR